MNVLYVSKASVVPAYRDKLHALAEHASVTAVLPDRWGGQDTDVGQAGSGAARIRTAPVILHGHNHLHMYRGAEALVRSAAPDIVHVDEEPYSAVTFQLAHACRRARVPFVFFAWQNLHKRLPPPFGLMRRYVFMQAAAGIAGTRRAADVLRRAGWAGSTAVIPQIGVSPERFRPDTAARTRMRAQHGIPPDAFLAGFAGRLVPEKGVDLLLDAAASLPGMHVLVVGTGPERRRLVRRAQRLGIAGRTHFIGAVESVDMPVCLNALDVLVLPSRGSRGWTEQFGRALVEAMACGVTVVGAASGEIPDVIGPAGLTFAEGSVTQLRACLDTLRDTPQLRRQLAESGRTRALELFTHDRIVRETKALYTAVLSGVRSDVANAHDGAASAPGLVAGTIA